MHTTQLEEKDLILTRGNIKIDCACMTVTLQGDEDIIRLETFRNFRLMLVLTEQPNTPLVYLAYLFEQKNMGTVYAMLSNFHKHYLGRHYRTLFEIRNGHVHFKGYDTHNEHKNIACPKCYGTGRKYLTANPGRVRWQSCPTCSGTGFNPNRRRITK